MIKTTRVEIVKGKSNRSNTILVTRELLQQFSFFNIPYNNASVITTREHPIAVFLTTMYLNGIDPAFMPLEHFSFTSLKIERPYDWVAASHKNVLLIKLHALDGFFGGNETFNDLILFKVHASDHFIPRSRKQHVILF